MRELLAIAKAEDFAVLFEYDKEQAKLFITNFDMLKHITEEYDFEEPLEYALNLIEKYREHGWDVVYAFGLDK